jgi:tetratricopeptide (TPR) repeat protein
MERLIAQIHEAAQKKGRGPEDRLTRAEIAVAQGGLLLRRRDFLAAAAAYEEAVDLDPERTLYSGYAAWARFSAGNLSARDALRSVLLCARQNRDDADLFYFAGVLFRTENNDERASQCFARALRLNPEMSAAQSELRVLMARQERVRTGRSLQPAPPRRLPSEQKVASEDTDEGLMERLQRPITLPLGNGLLGKLNRPIGEIINEVRDRRAPDGPSEPVSESENRPKTLIDLLTAPIEGNLLDLLNQPIDGFFAKSDVTPQKDKP